MAVRPEDAERSLEGEALTPPEAGEHESGTLRLAWVRGRFILEKKKSSDGPGGCSPEVTKFQAPSRHTSDKGNGAPTTSSVLTLPTSPGPLSGLPSEAQAGQRWLTHAWHSKHWLLSFLSPDHPGGSCDSHCPDWNARQSSETKQLSGQLRAAAETNPICQTEPTVLRPHSCVGLALGN